MTMRAAIARIARLASLVAAPLCVTNAQATPDAADDRPNVVLVLVDDMGYDDYGFAGNPYVRTPRLDSLAEHGVQWNEFYVSPVCGLTRAALLTGRYPQRVGVAINGMHMRPNAVTIAEVLRDAGYATAMFGKWHLGDHVPWRPMDQGFEETLVARGGVVGQLSETPTLVRYTNPVLAHNGARVTRTGYATDVYFTAALEWMRGAHDAGQPFFAYVSTNAPHRPYTDAPTPEYERYLAELTAADEASAGSDNATTAAPRRDQNARIYAMIERIDTNVGRLVDGLDAIGCADNTLLLFLSDNGPTHGRYSSGLRGEKGSIREGGLRTRFLARFGARLPVGLRAAGPAAHIDIAPTILDACGVEAPDNWTADGHSLMPWLRGDEEAEWPGRMLFFEAHQGRGDPRNNCAVRSGSWKLVRDGGFRLASRLAQTELYDLASDPLEARDVSGEHPEIVKRLRDGFEPIAREIEVAAGAREPRIPVGHPREMPLLLTRENWGRASWSVDDAVWKLRVAEAGLYDVRVFFEPSPAERGAAIWLGADRIDREVPRDATSAVFERVRLTAGPLDFSANIGDPSYPLSPAWQVEISAR